MDAMISIIVPVYNVELYLGEDLNIMFPIILETSSIDILSEQYL